MCVSEQKIFYAKMNIQNNRVYKKNDKKGQSKKVFLCKPKGCQCKCGITYKKPLELLDFFYDKNLIYFDVFKLQFLTLLCRF